MAQRLLHDQKHARPIGRTNMQQPVRRQAGTGQARREQVGRGGGPERRPLHARQYTGREQGRRRRMHLVRPTAGDFMQSAARQAPLGQMLVDGGDTKGQDTTRPVGSPLQQPHAAAQIIQAG